MRRPLCTILASFVLLSNLLEAQDSKSQSSKPGVLSTSDADATAVDLLQQSHNLSQQFPVSMRLMNLLPRQAEMVSRLRPDLGREWANELFTLSFQTQGAQRSFVQNVAIRMLVRLDPERALELLPSLSIEEPVPKWATSPPEMQLVQEVFEVLAARDGESALPLLEQEAERLGVQGHYPYTALGYAAMRATSNDWGHDNQQAIRILQSVFEPAFARYSQNAHRYFDDLEFGKMLQVLAGGLPLDSVKPALRLLVKNLLATETGKYQFEAEVYTSDGQTAKVHNAVDATILFFGTLINRDPELAEQLKSTRPELQTALEYAKFGRERSLNFGPARQPRNMQSVDSGAEARMDAVRLSHINAEAAIKKAEQLPDDDKRTSTLLEVARGIAGDYPERAAELIAESQSGNKPTDDQLQLNLISAQAFVAAAESKKDDLDELLQRGFESANRILLEQQRTGTIQIVAGLGPLVQIGIQNDPNLTVTFIESLSPSYLKAELLLGAASALSMRRPLPFGSRPQQKKEKLPETLR
ncbi:MAG: hypothetical protein WBR10_05675 [Candidatus Acidiferrum sp.]